MQLFLTQLDENLVFIKSEVDGDTMKIHCEFKMIKGMKVHSRNLRVIKDVSFGKYKVELYILAKKYFNADPNIDKLTIYEDVSFLGDSKRRTKRLDDLILETCKEMSAIGCERFVKKLLTSLTQQF